MADITELLGDISDVAGTVTDVLTLPLDWYYSERKADEERAARKAKTKIAMKELALREEEMGLVEKQRGFERLLELMTGSTKMTQTAAGISRLKAMRNA